MFLVVLVLVCVGCASLGAQGFVRKGVPADAPAESEINLSGVVNESKGEWRYLRGSAKVETAEFIVYADEIDFNSDTNWAYARGHVRFEHFVDGDKLNADHGEYNLKSELGRFYGVSGTSPAKVMTSPGLLTTTNPFYFEGRWAERLRDRYVIHKGFITDCTITKPWWTFDAAEFNIIPAERAIGKNTIFRLRHIPLFYLPYFYRPLGKHDRQSGFLTPNIGNSSTRGFLIGAGYYWAINPSYDLTYVLQYFTSRGPAHTVDFRGKPNAVSDFNFSFYGVQDSGIRQGNKEVPVTNADGTTGFVAQPNIVKEGGYQFQLTGRTQIDGFTGKIDYNYLSSYLFRQSFSQSITEAVFSEVNSVGYLQRHFNDDTYTLNILFKRNQLFENITAGQVVTIQKLPSVEFNGREREIVKGPVPVWLSFTASGSLLDRSEPSTKTPDGLGGTTTVQLNTGNTVGRLDLQPRVMTSFSFMGVHLTPSLTLGATDYTNSYSLNGNSYAPSLTTNLDGSQTPVRYNLAGANQFRHDAQFNFELALPTLERVYKAPKWLHLGEKVKHTIQVGAEYEYLTGINIFDRLIRFDETELMTDTNQLEVAVTNRLYKKDQKGNVKEVFSWRVLQQRYFDPSFGGAVQPNQRSVILSAVEITPYAFIDGPRNYSPIVSNMRVAPIDPLVVDWRTDYDPLRHRFVDNTISTSLRLPKYFFSVGETNVSPYTLMQQDAISFYRQLTPDADQIFFSSGYGNPNRRGWNIAASTNYDFVKHYIQYQTGQLAYNTDCCGFSGQFRRFSFGTRNENQFLFSFALANIGTFGSLQKQSRIF